MISGRFIDDGKALVRMNTVQEEHRKAVNDLVDSGQYVFQSVNCLICNSSNFETLAEKDRYGLSLSTIICRNCGLIQVSPRMDQPSYNHFYDNSYRPLYTGVAGPRECRLFHSKRESIMKFIGSSMNVEGKRVLEVGCGGGWNLQCFHEKGAEVKGIDLGSEYLEYGRRLYGFDLSNQDVFSLPDTREFDLIIYSHVLEHVLNPGEHLTKVKGLLNRGGKLYIELPGVKNTRKAYKADFLRSLQNAHVYYFSLTTLRNLLKKHGFSEVRGTEKIRSLWEVRPGELDIINDYNSAKAYLWRLEKLSFLRSYAQLVARLKSWRNKVRQGLLRKGG